MPLGQPMLIKTQSTPVQGQILKGVRPDDDSTDDAQPIKEFSIKPSNLLTKSSLQNFNQSENQVIDKKKSYPEGVISEFLVKRLKFLVIFVLLIK